jgi:hypothetical protein
MRFFFELMLEYPFLLTALQYLGILFVLIALQYWGIVFVLTAIQYLFVLLLSNTCVSLYLPLSNTWVSIFTYCSPILGYPFLLTALQYLGILFVLTAIKYLGIHFYWPRYPLVEYILYTLCT